MHKQMCFALGLWIEKRGNHWSTWTLEEEI